MITVHKNVGETPLDLIKRLQREDSSLGDKPLSYAGRLDPMAEGEMLILVGEENKKHDAYLEFDKEYLATFLIGVETDTGDVLGLHTRIGDDNLEKKEVETIVKNFKKIKSQMYPWFSSKTVNGKKLFTHFKEGNVDNIERPKRKAHIYEAELIEYKDDNKKKEIESYIFDSIEKVQEKKEGDFRKKEILEGWSDYFLNNKDKETFVTCSVRLKVSTGTYIRSLTELFPKPTVLLKLKRTKIFIE